MVYPITVIQRADPSGPTADILDVVFDENGSARDISAAGNTVKYVAGSACKMGWNDVYMKYAPSFSHKQAGSGITSGFYRVEYTDAMMSALDDGYTMEALIKPAKAPNGSEIKAFSATTSGGMAVMIGSTARGKGLEFIQHNGSAWCFASSGVVPEANVYLSRGRRLGQGGRQAPLLYQRRVEKERRLRGHKAYDHFGQPRACVRDRRQYPVEHSVERRMERRYRHSAYLRRRF